MLTQTTISDGRTVTLDIKPMTVDQQTALVTAVADLLIRSGQIRDDVALSGPHLLQFLSEAADMAEQQAKPVDPEDVVVFKAKTHQRILRSAEHYISTPDDFLVMREIDGTFDEGCRAVQTVEEAVSDDENLAESITTLLNRAFWLGQGRCAPFHVVKRS